MKLTTPTSLPSVAPRIDLHSRVMLLGSCFAEGVGQRLKDNLPEGHVMSNPFGVLYNPISIATVLSCLLDGHLPTEEMLFAGTDRLWHSLLHDGSFSAASKAECLNKVERQFEPACHFLRKTDILCLTWGTSMCYRHKATGLIAANCHKQPATTFDSFDSTPEEIAAIYKPLFNRLLQLRPELKVVLTVSPYRYLKYGLHGSALTKARLLLAADTLEQTFEAVRYFPAYEIVTDELRDYRFYAADMVHPSEQATDYVLEQFKTWCFSDNLSAFAKDKTALLRDHRHRPLHADSPAYDGFLACMGRRQTEFSTLWRDKGLNEAETTIG
ncbi:MAG: GSCFA domain-containing protein [Alloprevotella sp.]